MPRMRSANVRVVLLCFALLFQVLTFVKHNGIAYLRVPFTPDEGVGSVIGPGRYADRAAALMSGSDPSVEVPWSEGGALGSRRSNPPPTPFPGGRPGNPPG